MKKIMTKQEKEKKEARNKLIIGLVLVGLMVFSTAAYAFFSGENKNEQQASMIKYNGIEFSIGDNGLWHSQINGKDIYTKYNPKETENISIKNINFDYKGKVVYYSYDSDMSGVNEIFSNIGDELERYPQAVCISECEENLPVKSCDIDRIIVVKKSDETLIKQEENCVYITASEEETGRACDAFIFKLFKVM